MRKTDTYISYVSIVFNVIAYFNLIATIACFLICLFVPNVVAEYITEILFGVICIVFFVEHCFTPPTGVRGS